MDHCKKFQSKPAASNLTLKIALIVLASHFNKLETCSISQIRMNHPRQPSEMWPNCPEKSVKSSLILVSKLYGNFEWGKNEISRKLVNACSEGMFSRERLKSRAFLPTLREEKR